MGKRSNYKPRKMDQYFTFDPKAAKVLVDYIRIPDFCYIEPCAGKGDLVRNLSLVSTRFEIEALKSKNWKCVHAQEIDETICEDFVVHGDAFDLTGQQFEDSGADAIVTNPPWSRPILHDMIEHFASISPSTWLLFDADWMHTKQAIPYLKKYCTEIVSVGRLKWIVGSASVGKDNACWYHFADKRQLGFTGTAFFNG